MSERIFKFNVRDAIPEHLRKQIISKFAYVDEIISGADISDDGKQIRLELNAEPKADIQEELNRKVEFVVQEMTKGSSR